MTRIAIWILAAAAIVWAQSSEILFMGLSQGGAPAFEKRCGRQIREKLLGLEHAQLKDDYQTALLARRLNFDFPTAVSPALVKGLLKAAGDSVVLVWGRIDHLSIKPQRYALFGARALGETQLVLTLYSLQFKSYACVATIQASAFVPKPPALFRRVGLVTHISAEDQAKLTDQLSEQISGQAAGIVGAVIRHYSQKEASESGVENVEFEKVPSIENLFEIPSVEGTSLESAIEEADIPSPVVAPAPAPAPAAVPPVESPAPPP